MSSIENSKAYTKSIEPHDNVPKSGVEKSNPVDKPLTDKEKQGLLRDYESTKKRIELAEVKMRHCRDILDQLPVGHDSQKKAQESYNQAKVLFGKIVEDMADIQDPKQKAIVDMSHPLTGEQVKKLQEVLKEKNINVSNAVDLLISAEADAQKVIEMVNTLKGLGMKDHHISEIFSKSPRLGFANLVPFFKETKEMGLSIEDAYLIWISDSLYGEEPELSNTLDRIKWLKGLGIEKGIYQFLRTFQQKHVTEDVFKHDIKGFQELGLTKDELMDVVTSDCPLSGFLYPVLHDYLAHAKKSWRIDRKCIHTLVNANRVG